MPIIEHHQLIHAPIDLCFDLARSVDIHIQTTTFTNERAVAGVTTGLLEMGDTVTFEATHFGVKQKLTAKVIKMDKPHEFIDIMVKGAFHSFMHTHRFIEELDGTLMIDYFQYKSPFGVIGNIADRLFLERYMKTFIASRAEALKKIAENMKGDIG
ncbi:SRPBCC family protein [Ornithinibacillus bavariensis]|uniref:SRPBCC family protein n=1 Tax=Ornithinibacillus bavariensis TaxID=545502 RepID=UPI000EC32EDB|nr:cell division protein [Ornithinibacillus sp.]